MLHRMCHALSSLHTLNFKQALDVKGAESANAVQNRRVQMLRQALLVEKWVESFDSQKVNSFFHSEAKHRDPVLIEQVNSEFKKALTEIEAVDLSPNLTENNRQITRTKDALELGE